ncbi:MAG: hypothetical protein JW839_08960 [Candidatus Lokiarchaeota archaeon]|nr:hypothetical protein [Candidatus Lokiarchaeota archaeon]
MIDENLHLFGYMSYHFYTRGARYEAEELCLCMNDRNATYGAIYNKSSHDPLIYQILGFDTQPSVENAKRVFKERILNLKTRRWEGARKRLGEYLDWENFQFIHGFKDALQINGILPVGITQLSVEGGFDVTFTRKLDCPFIRVQEGLHETPDLLVKVKLDDFEATFYDSPVNENVMMSVIVDHSEKVNMECRLLPDDCYQSENKPMDEKTREKKYMLSVFSFFLISISEGITFGSIPEIRVWLRFCEAGDVDNPERMIESHFARFERETADNQIAILEEGMPRKLLQKEHLDRLVDYLVSNVTDVKLRAYLVEVVWHLADSLKDDRAKAALVSLFNKPLDPWKTLLEKHLGPSFKPQISQAGYDIEVLMTELDPNWNPIKFWFEQGGCSWEDVKEAHDQNIGDFFLVELANAGDPAAARTVYDSYFKDEKRFKDIISDNYDLFYIFSFERLTKYVETLVSENNWFLAVRVIASEIMSDRFEWDEECLEEKPENRQFLEFCKKNVDVIFDSLLKSSDIAIKDVENLFYIISPDSRKLFEKITYQFLKMKKIEYFTSHLWNDEKFRHLTLDAGIIEEARSNWGKTEQSIVEILDKRLAPSSIRFKINDYLSVIKEDKHVKILVDEVVFYFHFELVINISDELREERGAYIDDVESVDKINYIYMDRMGTGKHGEKEYVAKKGTYSVDEEFWALCSILQAWDENDYNSNLVYKDFELHLLKRLNEYGDPKAMAVYGQILIRRILDGSLDYGFRLRTNHFFHDVDDRLLLEKLKESFDSFSAGRCIALYREFKSDELSLVLPKSASYIIENCNIKAKNGSFDLDGYGIGFFIEELGIESFDDDILTKYIKSLIRKDSSFRFEAKYRKQRGSSYPSTSGRDKLIEYATNHKLDPDIIKQEILICLKDVKERTYWPLQDLLFWVKDDSFLAVQDYLIDTIIQDIRKSLPKLEMVPFLNPSLSFTVDADKKTDPIEMVVDNARNRVIICYEDGSLTAWNLESKKRELSITTNVGRSYKLLITPDANHIIILPKELAYPMVKISLFTGEIVKRVAFQMEKKPDSIVQSSKRDTLSAGEQDKYTVQRLKDRMEYRQHDRKWHARAPRDNKLICVSEANTLKLYDEDLNCVFSRYVDLSINSLVLIEPDKIIHPLFSEEGYYTGKLCTSTLDALEKNDGSTSVKVENVFSWEDELFVTQQGRYVIWPHYGDGYYSYNLKENAISNIKHGIRTRSSDDLVLSSDDLRLFQAGMIGIIWNMQNKTIESLLLDNDMEFKKGAFLDKSNKLVTISRTKTVKIWELAK